MADDMMIAKKYSNGTFQVSIEFYMADHPSIQGGVVRKVQPDWSVPEGFVVVAEERPSCYPVLVDPGSIRKATTDELEAFLVAG